MTIEVLVTKEITETIRRDEMMNAMTGEMIGADTKTTMTDIETTDAESLTSVTIRQMTQNTETTNKSLKS